MSRVAVIGSGVRVSGYVLAGAVVCAAETRDETRAAWASLPPDAEVVVLTAEAAGWLADVLGAGAQPATGPSALPRRHGVLPVVMPS